MMKIHYVIVCCFILLKHLCKSDNLILKENGSIVMSESDDKGADNVIIKFPDGQDIVISEGGDKKSKNNVVINRDLGSKKKMDTGGGGGKFLKRTLVNPYQRLHHHHHFHPPLHHQHSHQNPAITLDDLTRQQYQTAKKEMQTSDTIPQAIKTIPAPVFGNEGANNYYPSPQYQQTSAAFSPQGFSYPYRYNDGNNNQQQIDHNESSASQKTNVFTSDQQRKQNEFRRENEGKEYTNTATSSANGYSNFPDEELPQMPEIPPMSVPIFTSNSMAPLFSGKYSRPPPPPPPTSMNHYDEFGMDKHGPHIDHYYTNPHNPYFNNDPFNKKVKFNGMNLSPSLSTSSTDQLPPMVLSPSPQFSPLGQPFLLPPPPAPFGLGPPFLPPPPPPPYQMMQPQGEKSPEDSEKDKPKDDDDSSKKANESKRQPAIIRFFNIHRLPHLRDMLRGTKNKNKEKGNEKESQ